MSTPWRAMIAAWPLEARERWGKLANALEESGKAKFPESEELAYRQVCEADGKPLDREAIARWFQETLT